MKLFLAALLWMSTIAVSLAAGYQIRKQDEGQRLDSAYQGGFQACQEQF